MADANVKHYFALLGKKIFTRYGKKIGTRDKTSALIIDDYYPVRDLSKLWNQISFYTFFGLTIIMGHFGNTVFIYGPF